MATKTSKLKVGDKVRLSQRALENFKECNNHTIAFVTKIELRPPSNPLIYLNNPLLSAPRMYETWVEKVQNKKLNFSTLKIKD